MRKKIKDVSITTLLILIILYIFNIISTHGASIDQQMKDRQSINVEDKNAAFATSLANKKNMMSMIQAKNKAKIHDAGTTITTQDVVNEKDDEKQQQEQIVQVEEKDEKDQARSTVANVQDANVVVEKIVIRSLYINVEGAIREMYHTK